MHYSQILILIVGIGVFYALAVLPQRRQQKNKANMMKQLAPGAKILSAGGIYGEIISIHSDIYVVKIADDVEVEMDARAIIRVVTPGVDATNVTNVTNE